MRFQEKRNLKTKMYSKPVLIGLLVLLILLSKALVNLYGRYKESVSAEKIATQRLQELKDRQSVLHQDIGNLQSEQGQEEELRKKFNVGLDGEQMVVVVLEKENPEGQEKKGFFSQAWSSFLGWFK